MLLFPAIDLFEGKAVRLLRGDYNAMTVYSEHPPEIAADFAAKGATHIHLVDLEGAKSGTTPNLSVIADIVKSTDLFSEVGGGIRSMQTIESYLSVGVRRVILGTAALTNPAFLRDAVAHYGDKIAVGIDCKNGFVAVNGWTQETDTDCFSFCRQLADIGVRNIICTDISKDGAMQGTNHDLYARLSASFSGNITASGGVSSIEDVKRLAGLGLYGAILGKAYYTGAVDLRAAIEAAK